MAGGRPSKYKGKETISMAEKYIEDSGLIHQQDIVAQGKMYMRYKNTWRPNIPTMRGLSKKLGVARSTLYEWGNKHEAFNDILHDLVQAQEEILIQGGLAGQLNANMVIFILKGRADWR